MPGMTTLSADWPPAIVHQLQARADDYRAIIEQNATLLTHATKPDEVRATVQSVKYYAHRLADVMEELEASTGGGAERTKH